MVVYRFERGAKSKVILSHAHFCSLSSWFDRDIGDNTFKLLVNF